MDAYWWRRRRGGIIMGHLLTLGVLQQAGNFDKDPYAPVHGNEFTWNGFTYKVIVKDYGGTIGKLAWLDRNLGASRVAESSDDSESYGDLYQWGRLTDGHEKRSNTGTTTTQSSNPIPGHSDFIYSHWNWYSGSNQNDLWKEDEKTDYDPSPPGWRLPTEDEITAEVDTWDPEDRDGAFASDLKLPLSGLRSRNSGEVVGEGSHGSLWSSITTASDVSRRVQYNVHGVFIGNTQMANGLSVRCVRKP